MVDEMVEEGASEEVAKNGFYALICSKTHRNPDSYEEIE